MRLDSRAVDRADCFVDSVVDGASVAVVVAAVGVDDFDWDFDLALDAREGVLEPG